MKDVSPFLSGFIFFFLLLSHLKIIKIKNFWVTECRLIFGEHKLHNGRLSRSLSLFGLLQTGNKLLFIYLLHFAEHFCKCIFLIYEPSYDLSNLYMKY